MDEKWICVPNYEGFYEISNLGNIRSVDRIIKTKRGLKKYRGVPLNPSKSTNNYLEVRLHKVGKSKTFLVHRLVALSFLDNPNNYPIINHKDGNKLNYTLENLEWTTYQQNTQHAYDSKLIFQKKIKLTNNDKLQIKQMYSNKKITQTELANLFNVSQMTINRVIRK
jgi:hypothetical protein